MYFCSRCGQTYQIKKECDRCTLETKRGESIGTDPGSFAFDSPLGPQVFPTHSAFSKHLSKLYKAGYEFKDIAGYSWTKEGLPLSREEMLEYWLEVL